MRRIIGLVLVSLVLSCTSPAPAPTGAVETATPPVWTPPTAQLYRNAIADYMTEMGMAPDTLYIGRHPEFPSIELPDSIGRTTVLMLDIDVAPMVQDREHFDHLNVICHGCGTTNVEFFVVRFNQGMRHHTDGRDDRHLFYHVDAAFESIRLDSVTQLSN